MHVSSLSTLGTIALLKIIILPKLIYLFCTFNQTFFTSVEGHMTQFIWNKKPPRCANYILTRHHKQGGIGLLHICTYYYASTLDQLK